MGEEAQTKEVGPEPVDLTLFRRAQQELSETVVDKKVLKEAVNDNIQKSIGTDGVIDKTLFEFVEQYIEVVGEPYAVEYFRARDIYNGLTEENFESIDKYILDKIKNSNQKATFEVYEKLLRALEDALSLSDDHETMHRIVQISKFIEHGKNN